MISSYIKVSSASRLVGVSRHQIMRLVECGRLPHVEIPTNQRRSILINTKDLFKIFGSKKAEIKD